MVVLAGLAGLLGALLVYRQRAIDASARQFRAIYDQREEHPPGS
ncbi:hypothetical protein [Rhabdothermincola sp.]|jgi:hypothetical protein